MGLTFFSDRVSNQVNDKLYHCALPLTNITSITESMVTSAFNGANIMNGGGDSPEDVLLGRLITLLYKLHLQQFRDRFLTN